MTRDDSGAIARYEEALAVDPTFPYALESWRKALAVQADYQEGLPRFLSAVEAAGTPHAKDVRGRLLVDLGHHDDRHYDEAIDVFNELVQEYPKYKHSYCYWGVALRRKGDDTGAIEKCMEALDVDPTCSQAIGSWRTILRGAPAYESSVARFKNAAQDAMTVDAMHAVGVFHTEAKQYADAIGVFSQLAEKHPHDKRAFSSWGQALQYDQQFPSALEKYRHALVLDPNYFPALSNWRGWLRARGIDQQAEKEFMEAVQVAGTASARNELGLFYVDLACYEQAIEVFRQIADDFPHFKYAYYNWGYALRRLGDYDGASEKYRQAVTNRSGLRGRVSGMGRSPR